MADRLARLMATDNEKNQRERNNEHGAKNSGIISK